MYLDDWMPSPTPGEGASAPAPGAIYHSSDEEEEVVDGQFEDAEEVDADRLKAFVVLLAVVVLFAAEIEHS